MNRELLEELCRAIVNHGYEGEGSEEGRLHDLGINVGIAHVLGEHQHPSYRAAHKFAFELWKECVSKPDPVAYAKERIAAVRASKGEGGC